MSRRTFVSTMAVLLAGAWTPPGQTTARSATGQGAVESQKRAESMRVSVEVVIKGKDLKDALAKLKARKEALEKQLVSLGAAKETIEFSEASVTSTKTDRQRQMERSMVHRSLPSIVKAGLDK